MISTDILAALPYRGPLTRRQFERRARLWLLRHAVTPARAPVNLAGNCIVCGEAGRCPGLHTAEEVAAAHKAAANRPADVLHLELCHA